MEELPIAEKVLGYGVATVSVVGWIYLGRMALTMMTNHLAHHTVVLEKLTETLASLKQHCLSRSQHGGP